MSSFAVLGKGPAGPPGDSQFDLVFSSDEPVEVNVYNNYIQYGWVIDTDVAADDRYLVAVSIGGAINDPGSVDSASLSFQPEPVGAEGLMELHGTGGAGLFSICGCFIVGGSASAVAALSLSVHTAAASGTAKIWPLIRAWRLTEVRT